MQSGQKTSLKTSLTPSRSRTQAPVRGARPVLTIAPGTAASKRRSAVADNKHLQAAESVFVKGFLVGAADSGKVQILSKAKAVEPLSTGVYFEGVAMGLALLDQITPWHRGRWHRFVSTLARSHQFESHAAYGMALARFGRCPLSASDQFDPFMACLVIDGYGFHRGYFEPDRYLQSRELPTWRSHRADAQNLFDQGLGRAIWFVERADVERVADVIDGFPPERQSDLWAGVGVAASHAGGASKNSLRVLKKRSGKCSSHLAQGAAFGALIRSRSKLLALHTEQAVSLLCGVSTQVAAELTEAAMATIDRSGRLANYQQWQANLRAQLPRKRP